ncbi:MAG: VOC family protein [Oscillospiraceae bacterium]|nr:VOC family protein [Oscillospiraceae bacterium]
MELNMIHHVAIIVSDYAVSRRFYVEKLGLPILRETYRPERDDWKLDLKAGDIELEIFSGKNNPPRPNYPEALGLRHLAFRVADVEAAAKELEAKGIEVEPIRSDPIGGGRMTFFKDPDGLPLELHE